MSCQRDSSTATDPAEAGTCPGCGATHGVQRIAGTSPKVDAWTCTACDLHCAVTVVNAHLSRQPPSPARNDIARSILGLLPPEQRTAALLAVLRTEVTQRSGQWRHHDSGWPPVELPRTASFWWLQRRADGMSGAVIEGEVLADTSPALPARTVEPDGEP